MITPHLNFEKAIWAEGFFVCGVDEVGRGCLAGPVVAAAVILPKNHQPHQKIRDSKKMTPKNRDEMFNFILENAVDFGIGLIDAKTIDEIGIGAATEAAMTLAVNMLNKKTTLALIDGREITGLSVRQKAIIKGDAYVYSISAASIVAKVFRDKIVSGLDKDYDGYNFSSHKGYGTKEHYAAIMKNGMTFEHRKTFLRKMDLAPLH